jgi:hypothetical protein
MTPMVRRTTTGLRRVTHSRTAALRNRLMLSDRGG